MKLSVSQSKSRSTADRARQPLLDAFHFRRTGRSSIVETSEMQKAMNNVEPQLVVDCSPELASLPLRGLDADHDVAMLKRNHVGRTGFVHELPMDFRNAPVGNEHHADFHQVFQDTGFSRAQLQALRKHRLRERFQRARIHREFALTIQNADHVNGRVSAWKFRVINRAPLLNVT